MFLGYAEHNVAYRFFVLKSDVIEHNTIVETKNIEFFEHIFPSKVSDTFEKPHYKNRVKYDGYFLYITALMTAVFCTCGGFTYCHRICCHNV